MVSGHGDEARPSLVEHGQQAVDGPVVIRVEASAINYKDALALTGAGRIMRTVPLIAGIDAAGTIVASTESRWQVGQPVLICGRGLGEERDGGLAAYLGVQADDPLELPLGGHRPRRWRLVRLGKPPRMGWP